MSASPPSIEHLGVAADEPPPIGTRIAMYAARIRNDAVIAAQDAVAYAGCLLGAMLLRYGGSVPAQAWHRFSILVPLICVVALGLNWLWGLYGQIWRYASVLEARRVFFAGASTGVVAILVVLVGPRLAPVSVVAFGTLAYTTLIGASRFQSRLFSYRRQSELSPGLRVVVIGGGEVGAALIRQMRDQRSAAMTPIAVLDDDPRKQGKTILGVRVAGPVASLTTLLEDEAVHQLVLAIRAPSRELVRRVARLAEQCELPLRLVPDMMDVVRHGVHLEDLRALQIEDLLGRQQVVTGLDAIRALLEGRRVLITGAGGSIGSEIARQVAACNPAELLVLDHDETHLHDLAATLHRPCKQLLVDIRDLVPLTRVFLAERPEIVFHAAAHKHVPLLEDHPAEAVRTNVVGTHHVVAAADAAGVQRLVFISTDKAVRPKSVMGASKRLAEDVVLASGLGQSGRCAVRFGNVLGSRGSVVPTFLAQIESGGPVTVTDPRMTRFFMSIPEAVQLVLQAAAMATGGEIFMLEMGDPVRIIDLARRMIRLSGRRIGTDVELRITGVRPGEKLTEELNIPEEEPEPTIHPSIIRLNALVPTTQQIEATVRSLEALAFSADQATVRQALFEAATGHGGRSATRTAPAGDRTIDLTKDATWSRSII
jgi:FlaA1/EpsC-like NDP-sugar epimerase